MRKQNKRHAIAVGLAAALAVALLPVSALATSDASPVAGLVQASSDDAIIVTEDEVTVAPEADVVALSVEDDAAAASDEGDVTTDVASVNNLIGYSTLQEAINYAQPNDTVYLNADVNEVVTITKQITLNLQGHSISTSGNYTVFADADVTIQGAGSITGGNYGVVVDGVMVTLKNVDVSAGVACHVQNSGALISQEGSTMMGSGARAICVNDGASAKIADSTVSASAGNGITNYGTLEISGTTSVSSDTAYGVLNQGNAKIAKGATGTVSGSSMGVANLGTFTISGGYVGDGNTTYGIVTQGGTAAIEGGTVTGSYVGLFVSYAGTANISGGTIRPTAGEDVEAYAIKINGDIKGETDGGYASTVNVTGGSIIADQGKLPCGVVILGNGATFTMNNGSIYATAYAISGNGVAENAGTNIEIGGGRITSTGETACAIYHPQAGTLKINGTATITGSTGVQLCSGTGIVGSISGGTINATGEDLSIGKTGDGVVPDGSAISILDRNYPGGTPSFKIVGGVFKSQHNDAVTAYTWDGTTRSNWAEANEYVSIEGGLFYGNLSEPSEIVAPSYVAPNHAAAKYDSTGYRVGKLVTLTLNSTGVDNANVTYEVKGNTASAVSGVIPVNDDGTYTLVAGSTVLLNAVASDGNVICWSKGDSEISSMSSCFYQIISDAALTAQLSSTPVVEAPSVSLAMTEGSVALGRYYYTVAATCNVPNSYSVVRTEIRGGTSPDSVNTLIASSAGGEKQHVFQTFMRTPTSTSVSAYYQASLIVSDGNGNEVTVKSNVICVDGSQYASYTDVLGFVPLDDALDAAF